MVRKIKAGTQMKNSPTNESINKWRVKAKIWLKRAIILVVVYGLYWLFAPLLGVKLDIYWDKMNLGIKSNYSDYYYVNIGGITYAGNKFYVLLRKPYLFNASYGSIYSSRDLTNWQEELVKNKVYTTTTSTMNLTDYKINKDGYTFVNVGVGSDEYSDITNDLLPRYISGSCYVIDGTLGLVSSNCNEKWQPFDFISESEINIMRKIFNNRIHRNTINNINVNTLISVDYCKFYKENIFSKSSLTKEFCVSKLSAVNINAYHVLYKIVQNNRLDIMLDGSHTTYGDGKYVGIFYKNKQYYFIISTDGIHYEIKPAPSELVSSLAIKLFN